MRNAVLVAASLMAAGLLAGCAGGADRSTTTAARPTAEPSPTLVSFKRWAGSDPEEDDVLIRRDHTAVLRLIHHFRTVRLSGSEWSALMATRPEQALAHPGPVVDQPIRGGYHYVVTVPGLAPVVGDSGVLPRHVQRVVRAMNRIVDDHAF